MAFDALALSYASKSRGGITPDLVHLPLVEYRKPRNDFEKMPADARRAVRHYRLWMGRHLPLGHRRGDSRDSGITPGPGVQLDHTQLEYARLVSIDLTDSRFDFSNLTNANLSFSTLTQANLSGANLSNAYLHESTLTNANLSGATVTRADFDGTTSLGFTKEQLYSTASYQAKNLQGIALGSNDLTGWNFSGQNLSNALLYGASLRGANLTGANLKNAYLGTASLTSATFSSTTIYNQWTVFPTGFDGKMISASLL